MLTGMVSMATICRATQLGAEECQFKPIANFEEIGNAADRAYEKMLRWWRTFREWKERNSAASKPLIPTDSYPLLNKSNPSITMPEGPFAS